jgi:hypothetical protein
MRSRFFLGLILAAARDVCIQGAIPFPHRGVLSFRR